ncbi:MAG TPA: hypothetical protein VFY14_07035 [Streptomyces sp.]|nr:hypothetical protein [Streptomyces sp.]
MPRKEKAADDPTALRNSMGVMLSDDDIRLIKRVASAYGMSKAGALRLLMRAGAARHDPFTPSEDTE